MQITIENIAGGRRTVRTFNGLARAALDAPFGGWRVVDTTGYVGDGEDLADVLRHAREALDEWQTVRGRKGPPLGAAEWDALVRLALSIGARERAAAAREEGQRHA